MKITNPLIAVPVKYGLVGGILLMFLFFSVYTLGRNPILELDNFVLVGFILLLFILFSIKEFRHHGNKSSLKFGQGMTVGFITYFLNSLVSSLLIWLFISFQDPTLVDNYNRAKIEYLEVEREEIIEKWSAEAFEDMYRLQIDTTAEKLALDDFLKKIIIGLFLTIIISIIFKKQI